MKKSTKLISSMFAIVFAISLFSFNFINSHQHYKIRSEKNNPTNSYADALEYLNALRANPLTGKVEQADVLAARQQVNDLAKTANKTNALGLTWQEIGPDNVGGRTRAILIDKQDATGNTVYAGGVSGGLWRTINGGLSWSKFAGYATSGPDASLIVTSICQASNNDIYVGTGEYSNSPQGIKESEFIGGGIYKMPVGSSTFTLIPTTKPIANATANSDFAICHKLAASPTIPGRIYVATAKGFIMTDDGFATWTYPIYNSATHYDGNGNVDFAGGGNKNFNNSNATVNKGFAADISVGSDGSVIVSVDNKGYISPSGDDNTFSCVSNYAIVGITEKGKNSLPAAGLSSTKFAIAPSNPNYIYASISNSSNKLEGIYQSKNKGTTWTVIGPGGTSAFEPFDLGSNPQGWYDNTIAVNPTNPNKIIMGGIEYYAWQNSGGVYQISSWLGGDGYPFYMHADAHEIMWHPTNPDICYFGNDGGVFKSINANSTNPTFTNVNKGYAVTQFYSVGFSGKGSVIAGAQDNGTQYIDYSVLGSGLQSAGTYSAIKVKGGDGFSCDISSINSKAMFATYVSGELTRSSNGGGSFSPFYNAGADSNKANSAFNTIVRLWESFNNKNSRDSIKYVVPTGGVTAGETITMKSKTSYFPFNYTFTKSYPAGAIVPINDPVQARMAVALFSAIWICSNPLDFSVSGNFTKLAQNSGTPTTKVDINGNSIAPILNDNISGTVLSLNFSVDGNYLFATTLSGNVYVIKNLNSIKRNSQEFYPPSSSNYNNDLRTQTIANSKSALVCRRLGTFPNTATEVAVDPQDPNNIVVTLGNYGVTKHVYRCTNATTAPSSSNTSNFTDITNNLPAMPVYSAIIDFTNSNKIVLGTEYGIYGSDDNGATWAEENNGMERVPVHMLRQQTLPWDKVENSGVMYIGTHGRGIFKSNTLLGIKDIPTLAKQNTSQGIVYPNPVTDVANVIFSLIKTSDVEVKIYDLQGRIVKSFNLENKPAGEQTFSFDKNGMLSGTYFVSISANETKQVTKFVVIN